MAWRIGVDTGGTFTDVCLYDAEKKTITVAKVSSTPADPGQAVLDGVAAAISSYGYGDREDSLGQVGYLAHGTTVATNALLQLRGAKVGLITTGGFRDLLELGRQRRPKLYDLSAHKPEPLVPRDMRLEISERITFDGRVETAADIEEIRAQARELKRLGVTAVAVCFLYSYLRPEHEKLVREVLEHELPDAFLSISHEVLPEFREYERLSTVVVNAFIGPAMQSYLSKLRVNLAAHGLPVMPVVTQSNGGVMSFPLAEKLPVRTVLSGPSTGVIGAARVSSQSGIDNVITFDMGGTSSDVALVNDARPTTANGMILDGRPVHAPMLDINTVGAGGGSIAWVDEGGHLKVGPQSAGAYPGPACYGLGNEEPTVTDANIVLGVLNQKHLLAGQMPIEADLAFQAVEKLGKKLNLSVVDTAQGIISVVVANMARAIRVISVQRGYDPVNYSLVSFGGAGPLHSARLAAELGMASTIIPHYPGAMSAIGMLMTDLRSDYARTARTPMAAAHLPIFEATLAALQQDAESWFEQESVQADDRSIRWVLDVRYVGQNYEIGVECPVVRPDSEWLDGVKDRFHAAHSLRYGYSTPEAKLEAVTFRVEAAGSVPQVEFPAFPLADFPVDDAIVGSRAVSFPEAGGAYLDCKIFDRRLLGPGHVVVGPAVVEQYDTTTLILPNQIAQVDERLLMVTSLVNVNSDKSGGQLS
jgi:N-methylhydantoinase A